MQDVRIRAITANRASSKKKRRWVMRLNYGLIARLGSSWLLSSAALVSFSIGLCICGKESIVAKALYCIGDSLFASPYRCTNFAGGPKVN